MVKFISKMTTRSGWRTEPHPSPILLAVLLPGELRAEQCQMEEWDTFRLLRSTLVQDWVVVLGWARALSETGLRLVLLPMSDRNPCSCPVRGTLKREVASLIVRAFALTRANRVSREASRRIAM